MSGDEPDLAALQAELADQKARNQRATSRTSQIFKDTAASMTKLKGETQAERTKVQKAEAEAARLKKMVRDMMGELNATQESLMAVEEELRGVRAAGGEPGFGASGRLQQAEAELRGEQQARRKAEAELQELRRAKRRPSAAEISQAWIASPEPGAEVAAMQRTVGQLEEALRSEREARARAEDRLREERSRGACSPTSPGTPASTSLSPAPYGSPSRYSLMKKAQYYACRHGQRRASPSP